MDPVCPEKGNLQETRGRRWTEEESETRTKNTVLPILKARRVSKEDEKDV
jgi:hypothetical protein